MEETGDSRDHREQRDHQGDIEELIAPYVLGALEPDEVERVELHLLGCARCRALVDEQRRVVSALPYLAEPQPVPLRARRSLLARIAPHTYPQARPRESRRQPAAQPGGSSDMEGGDDVVPGRLDPQPRARRVPISIARMGWVAAIVAAVLAGIFFWNGQQMQSQVNQTNSELSRVKQGQDRVAEILSTDGAVTTLKSTGAAPSAEGGIVLNPNQNAAIIFVNGLPKPPPGHAYVVWMMHGNTHINAGVLPVDDQGHGQLYINPPEALSTFDGILVTEESGQLAANPKGIRMMQAQVGP